MGADGRLKVAVLFGGRSVEHEVSIVSARSIMAALDPERFEAVPVGISKTGTWLTPEETEAFLRRSAGKYQDALTDEDRRGLLARPQALEVLTQVDVVFPMVHGTNGEDGTLQGLLELARVPYVGAGVTASALGMDKALQKVVFRAAGIPVADWITVLRSRWEQDARPVLREVEERIGYPCFVKPANGGSSVGVSKVRSREDMEEAVAEAGRYDRKILVERAVQGREIECSVLGNDDPEASPLGEVVPSHEFYDYAAKYLDDSTQIIVPTTVPEEAERRIRELAVAAFRAIDCAGMARVDFFLQDDGEALVNEINTIPGFTSISQYPKLWEAAGLPYRDLLTRLIELALERFHEGEASGG
ncbi:MAG TPA: D-alanine--D-alanine ligase family protein [Dehalococcoidia bacterium]